jgi:hypothetical protein
MLFQGQYPYPNTNISSSLCVNGKGVPGMDISTASAAAAQLTSICRHSSWRHSVPTTVYPPVPHNNTPAWGPPLSSSMIISHPPPFLPPWLSCVDKMSLQPPIYTPSAAVPAYSVMPRPSERILAATGRSRRRTPTGVFKRSSNLITVALREQEPDASMPSYGRHGAICGDIGLSYTQGVQSVYVKVRFSSTGFLLRSSFFLIDVLYGFYY